MNKIEDGNLTRRGRGRPKGAANKTTALLKDAILTAAQGVGEDGSGKDGLTGYLTFLAKTEARAFAGLLGKVLPMQVTGSDEGGPAFVVEVVRFSDAGKAPR